MGIQRREFLYEILFWEAKRIIRGYRRRNILQYQLLRLDAFCAAHSMGNPKGTTPTDWLPLPFDDDIDDDDPPISEEEQNELLDMIAEMNEHPEVLETS